MTTTPPAAAAAAAPPLATAPPQRSTQVGSCEPYDPQTEPWDLFIERFDFFIIGNRMTDLTDKEKQGIFLNCCGKHVHQIARSIATPKSMHEIDWTELRDGLQRHFAPKPSALTRRFKFYARNQKEGETIANFLAAIRVLAAECEFGPQLDDMIRDRLVGGLQDDKLRRRLVSRPNCPLATAIEEALGAEATYPPSRGTKQGQIFQTAYEEEGDDDLFQDGDIQQVKPTWGGPKMAASSRQTPCGGCNGGHRRSNCPYLHTICSHCHKKGHIYRACRTLLQSSQPTGGARGSNYRRGGPPNTRWPPPKQRQPDADCYTVSVDIQQTSGTETNKHKIRTTVSINGKDCEMQIDSGSPFTIVSWATIKHLMPELTEADLTPTKTTLRDYQGNQILVLGCGEFPVKFKKFSGHLPIIITKRNLNSLLGLSWFKHLGLTIAGAEINNISSHLEADIAREFEDVFTGELGKYRGTPISFSLDPSVPPIRLKPRRVPLALKPKVDEQLDKLIAQGVLIPIDHARWETPIVTPIKPDGSVRLCADYKCTLNKALQWHAYPVPVVQHLLHSLGQGRIFAKLDLAQAYQQLPVDDATAEAQTIVTHRGAFKCTRLQFGVSTAPGIFQSLMERLLQGIPGVTPYFDDVLIAAMDPADLLQKLKTTLLRFRNAGLKLNKDKCYIGVPEVEFLGFKIDASGIHPTEAKTAAIHNAPTPQNKTELQAFLGLLNFYSMFLRNKATVAEPLHRLLDKTANWTWGGKEQQAFQAAKQLVTSDSLLVQYNELTPLQLTCDASPYGVGAVLSHVFPDGSNPPIAFFSRTLSAAERNYSQLDKEALAVVAGIKRFHDYLYGRKFSVITDHKPLLGLIAGDKQTPQVLSPRLTRWTEFLAAYSYSLEHKPGSQITHADALSRCPVQINLIDPAQTHPVLLLEHLPDSPVSAKVIAEFTPKDHTMATVLQWVLKGWPTQPKGGQFKPYENRKTELSTQKNCLLWGHRVIIPPPLQSQIMTSLHEGHPGIARMKALARSYVWWPHIDADIENKVGECTPCQESRPAPPAAPSSTWDVPQNPWSRLHIDFAGPIQGQMLFILVDAHSNWIEVHPMRSATTEAVIMILQKLFATHGLPDVVVSDNGPQFTAEPFNKYLEGLGVRHTTSAPYRPNANGKAERAVRSTKDALSRMITGNLNQKVNTFLLAQHSTPSPTTNRSPAELLMGRKIKIPLNRVHPDDLPTHTNPPQEVIRTFQEGEGIYARNYPGPPKWVPGTVVRQTGPKSYEVRLEDDRLWKRHVDQLRARRNNNANNDPNPREQSPDYTEGGTYPGIYGGTQPMRHAVADIPRPAPSLTAAAGALPLPPNLPPPPSTPQPPRSNPKEEIHSGKSSSTEDTGSNEQSLRRSSRERHRPSYLKDYACAVTGSGTLHPRGEECCVLRMRGRSLHSGPRARTIQPTADWLPAGRLPLAGDTSQWESVSGEPRQTLKAKARLNSSSYDWRQMHREFYSRLGK